MKLWIARDKDGGLTMFKNAPNLHKTWWYSDLYMILPESEFPEVTFENSPQEVELKII